MNLLFKYSAAITMALLLSACTALSANEAKTPLPLIKKTLQSQVIFSPWNTKGLGESKPYDTITVIASQNLESDIVILRWNDAGTAFTAELYRQSNTNGIFKSWEYQGDDVSKSITQQPGGAFYISELIGGKDGGSRKEVFRLD